MQRGSQFTAVVLEGSFQRPNCYIHYKSATDLEQPFLLDFADFLTRRVAVCEIGIDDCVWRSIVREYRSITGFDLGDASKLELCARQVILQKKEELFVVRDQDQLKSFKVLGDCCSDTFWEL